MELYSRSESENLKLFFNYSLAVDFEDCFGISYMLQSESESQGYLWKVDNVDFVRVEFGARLMGFYSLGKIILRCLIFYASFRYVPYGLRTISGY